MIQKLPLPDDFVIENGSSPSDDIIFGFRHRDQNPGPLLTLSLPKTPLTSVFDFTDILLTQPPTSFSTKINTLPPITVTLLYFTYRLLEHLKGL